MAVAERVEYIESQQPVVSHFNMTENPLMRWWIIVASMMVLVLGWLGCTILVLYPNYLAAQQVLAMGTTP